MPAPFYHGSPPPRGPESLSAHVRDLANAFASAAGVISDQYTILDNATSGLLTGTNPWQGQGAASFSTAWQAFGKYMQQMQKVCEDIYNSLIKFANKLSDVEAQQVWDILLTIVGGILTLISFLAAIAEFGLNPFVDSFTAFIGTFTEQEGSSVVNAAEEITQADTQAATELQQLETELTTSPTLTGPTTDTPGGVPDPVSQVSIDEMMQDINEIIVEDNPSEFLARGGKQFEFQNKAYFNSKPGMNRMPPGLNDPEAQYWIQQIKNKGVDVLWNHDVQVDLLNKGGYGITYNPVNYNLPNPSSGYIVVGLSPDADATTVYEEYLHVTEAENRGWLPYNDVNTQFEENYIEEIRVEYQVMQNAQRLGTSQKMWNILSTNRQRYIQLLTQAYGNKPIPADIQQYFNDPPMPPNLP